MTQRIGFHCTVLAAALAAGLACGPRGEEQGHEARGVVVAVDAAKGQVTLDHEDIPGLMKAMTMSFEADPALLAGIEAGQQVEFRVHEDRGRYVVTEIEPRR